MRTTIIAAMMILSVSVATSRAHAISCLSGGAEGALAGHMAGHGVRGAIGGCIAGHEWHKHQLRERNLQSQGAYDARRRHYDSDYRSPWEH